MKLFYVSAVTCDIGSAAFNYDMRRLNEILDVPKAWYKRDLYRRMFLGKSGVYVRESAHKSQMFERLILTFCHSFNLLRFSPSTTTYIRHPLFCLSIFAVIVDAF